MIIGIKISAAEMSQVKGVSVSKATGVRLYNEKAMFFSNLDCSYWK
jgi:hypothetical protein